MSQKEIFIILKELGGRATTEEIKDCAKEKFPKFILYTYVTDRLKKLKKSGYVEKTTRKNDVIWKLIKKDYP